MNLPQTEVQIICVNVVNYLLFINILPVAVEAWSRSNYAGVTIISPSTVNFHVSSLAHAKKCA